MVMLVILLLVLIPISLAGPPAHAAQQSGTRCDTDADCPLGFFGYSCLPTGGSESSLSQHTCQVGPVPPTECRIILCEHGTMHFSCPAGKVLSISYAMYGRLDCSVCPHPNIASTSCDFGTADGIVKAACNGQQICKIEAKNVVYGSDPCGTTYKYLEATYIHQ